MTAYRIRCRKDKKGNTREGKTTWPKKNGRVNMFFDTPIQKIYQKILAPAEEKKKSFFSYTFISKALHDATNAQCREQYFDMNYPTRLALLEPKETHPLLIFLV